MKKDRPYPIFSLLPVTISSLPLNTDIEKAVLCAFLQGRSTRSAALEGVLTDGGSLPTDLTRLIAEFDENSSEEIKALQLKRSQIHQERQNRPTLFKALASFVQWITS